MLKRADIVELSSHLCLSVRPSAWHPQKHPDFPKKPLTPYFRFFMEKRAKYAKLHPEMSNLDLTKILSKKYRELPDKKKVCFCNPFLSFLLQFCTICIIY